MRSIFDPGLMSARFRLIVRPLTYVLYFHLENTTQIFER